LIWLVNIAWFDIARDWQFNLAAGLFDSSKAVSIFRFQGSYFQIQVWQAEFLLQSSKNCFQSTCPAFFAIKRDGAALLLPARFQSIG